MQFRLFHWVQVLYAVAFLRQYRDVLSVIYLFRRTNTKHAFRKKFQCEVFFVIDVIEIHA